MSFIENLQFYILISVNVYDRISVVLQEGVDTMSYKEDVRMIKALADENRLRILECLHHGEKCACVILEELSITQSTLSHHMKLLCDCGLGCTTQFQRKGKNVLRICFLIILKPLIQMVDAAAISANNIYIRQSGKIAFLLNAYIDICKSIKLSGG